MLAYGEHFTVTLLVRKGAANWGSGYCQLRREERKEE
jgi:hypothetical protein